MSSNQLDRAGTFRARPTAWSVKRFDNSKSVKINVRFDVLECLNDDGITWEDWTQYVPQVTSGDFFVIKKDGSVNTAQVEPLSQLLGWKGSFHEIATAPPPVDAIVQIVVEPEDWKGKTYFRVSWMNPADSASSGSKGESPEDAKQLDAQFGSLLRAAASAKATPKPAGKPASPPPRAAKKPEPKADAESGTADWDAMTSGDAHVEADASFEAEEAPLDHEADARSRQ